jgi:hypothetical protein
MMNKRSLTVMPCHWCIISGLGRELVRQLVLDRGMTVLPRLGARPARGRWRGFPRTSRDPGLATWLTLASARRSGTMP